MRRAPGAVRGGIARDAKSVLFGGARRRRLAAAFLAAAVVAAAMTVVLVRPAFAVSAWPVSTAAGTPNHGHLVDGVQLPDEGFDFFTWDPVLNTTPDRPWRRWGTDRLLSTVYDVIADYRAAGVGGVPVPRVGIMDLSRRHGGPFGRRYGGLGHASHQNGLDVDVLYPRLDGRERRAFRVDQVDRVRAQALVDRFVAAGAQYVFVGPHLGLTGPKKVVVPLVYHDDHLHVRIR